MSKRKPKTKIQIKTYLKTFHKAAKVDKLEWNDDDTGLKAVAELHGISADELYQIAARERPQKSMVQ